MEREVNPNEDNIAALRKVIRTMEGLRFWLEEVNPALVNYFHENGFLVPSPDQAESNNARSAMVGTNGTVKENGGEAENQGTQEGVVSELEKDNSRRIVEAYGNFVRDYKGEGSWAVKNLFCTIVWGDYKMFTDGMKRIVDILHANNATQGKKEIERKFLDNILNVGYIGNPGYTILMFLCAYHGENKKCWEVGHGYCEILKYICERASPHVLKTHLMIRDRAMGRTALHFAAVVGQYCQLSAIIQAGINRDICDSSGRTALIHIIERGNIDMMSVLLWAGADISKPQSNKPHVPPVDLAHRTPLPSPSDGSGQQLSTCLSKWVQYVEERFMAFAKYLTCDESNQTLFDFRDTPCSQIHCVPFCRDSDNISTSVCREEDLLRYVKLDIKDCVNEHLLNDYKLSLFMIPAYYYRPPNDPQNPVLCRTDFYTCEAEGIFENVIVGDVILETEYDNEGPKPLISEIEPSHQNGYFYMFRLPDGIVPNTHQLHFNLDVKRLKREQVHGCFFLVGAVATREKNPKSKPQPAPEPKQQRGKRVQRKKGNGKGKAKND